MLLDRFQVVALAGLLLAGGALPGSLRAEEEKAEPTREEKWKKAYPEKTRDSHLLKGLLHLRRKEGKLFAELRPGDLKKRFLVLTSVSRGVGEGSLHSGLMNMGNEVVIGFQEVEDRILVKALNIRFEAEKGSPEAEAVALSYSDSVVASLKIQALGAGGERLVRLDGFLLADQLGLAGVLSRELGGGYALDGSRSRWESVKAFPENLELRSSLVFRTSEAKGGSVYVPDDRSVQLGVHTSVVAMPDGKYEAREADDRVGYFLRAVKDLSRKGIEGPMRRVVNRWKLEKADPKADRSPVKQPIVFYLNRNVPYRWRPYLRQGILEWNKAFEKVGFLDAVEVRYQGPEEDWDPEDVRYNTVSWILGEPHFGAIGPSHHDPVTGQILDADILFNGSMVRNFWREAQLHGIHDPEPPGEAGAGIPGPRPGRHPHTGTGPGRCEVAQAMQQEFALAATHYLGRLAASGTVTSVTPAGSGDDEKKDEKDEKDEKKEKKPPELPEAFVGAAIRWVITHEVGHTLGLRHNFKGSSVVPMDKLHDAAWTREHGLVGSVMDYPATNLAPEGVTQGEYFSSTLGPYDYWAIEYGYKPVDSPEELEKIAARAAEPELAYGSDEDRLPMLAIQIDPLTQAGDLGDDPLTFAKQRLGLVRGLKNVVLERVVPEGASYRLATRVVRSLMGAAYQCGDIASVYLGGQYHHRDHRGDPSERPAFQPVPVEKQREALRFLVDELLDGDAFEFPPELLLRLAPDHWWHWGNFREIVRERLDFPHHRIVGRIRHLLLRRILDPWLLERLLNQERTTPPGQQRLGLPELLETLGQGIFSELRVPVDQQEWTDRAPFVPSFRRHLQRDYLDMLGDLALDLGSGWVTDARGLARRQLREHRKALAGVPREDLDRLSGAHLDDLIARIDEVLRAERRLGGE